MSEPIVPNVPLPGADDTIAALATPPGRGAIALVRLSGRDAHAIAARVVAPWPIPPRTIRLCTLTDPDTGAVVDEAVVTRYDAPRSYTGEDMVEVATHGGHLVPALAIGAFAAAGAREALPGEFTRRAVLHGKMDLLQAEAVGDLVDARSRAAHAAALRQLDGGLSQRVLALRDQLIEIEALIAYDIDFPEEDEGPVSAERIARACDATVDSLDALLATAPSGELVRDGATVVIAGAPNAGKSSLFNALLGRARALVTEIPGTTRDALEAVIEGGRWPLRLVDTAGLRATTDVVERLGIEVSERYLAEAHVVLACGDSAASLRETVERARRLSAATGAGLRALVETIDATIAERVGAPPADVPLLTRARHERAIRRAREELAAFRAAWHAGALPAPVAAVHLRAAVGALEELIGAVDVEDVLGRVFSTFCVGK